MMDIKEVLLQWFVNFIDKKSSATRVDKVAGGATKNKNMPNQQLAEELHKPIIRKYQKCKIHSSFIDNIWDADLADMQLISKVNTEIQHLIKERLFC